MERIRKIDPGLIETTSIMKDKKLMKAIEEAKEDVLAGRLHSYEEVFGKK